MEVMVMQHREGGECHVQIMYLQMINTIVIETFYHKKVSESNTYSEALERNVKSRYQVLMNKFDLNCRTQEEIFS